MFSRRCIVRSWHGRQAVDGRQLSASVLRNEACLVASTGAVPHRVIGCVGRPTHGLMTPASKVGCNGVYLAAQGHVRPLPGTN